MKLLLGLSLALAAIGAAPSAEERIALPAEIAYPEGIAVDTATRTAYVAGTSDGTIAKVDLASGKATVLSNLLSAELAGAFPGVLGLALDSQGRLWMAGGLTRKIFVADAATGRPIATIGTQTESRGLINDLAIAGGKAFFTDTLHPRLWAVDLAGPLPAAAEPWLDFAAGGPLTYAEGANLNGIVATPDGKALIVGQMQKGLLFRIDVATRGVTPIDLKGETVPAADGLELRGDALFVVRQSAGEIVTIRLAADLASGIVVKRTTPGLGWPATAALDSGALLVVNTQFDKHKDDSAVRPFTIARVPLAELGVE